jgi:predicted  nucleic acid-binding Zn-ribbon protein
MSRSAPLYALQQIDNKISACRQRLATINEQLGETEELVAMRDRLNEIRASLKTWRIRQRDEELQLHSVQQKMKASEHRLYGGRVRNPKELSDLQAEVKSLARRRQAIEESVFAAMLTIEELETTERRVAQDLHRMEQEWQAEQSELRAEQEAQTAHLAELLSDRKGTTDTILPADLSAYEHLRERKGGLAVAQLRGAECQGCMTTVSASRVKEARGNSLAFCGTCGRILYPTT